MHRALLIPEILGSIFAFLQPLDMTDTKDLSWPLNGSYYRLAAAAEVATCNADLLAAALVNRTWFAIAMPILWQRPPESALSPSAFVSAARRSFYAAHVRVVRITGKSALWHALAVAADYDDGAVPSETAAQDDSSLIIAGGDGDEGFSTQRLHFPRLTDIHFPTYETYGEWVEKDTVIDALLPRLLKPGLVSLSCRLSGDVLDYLEGISKRLAMALDSDDASIAGENEKSWQAVEMQAGCLQLRKLHLGKCIRPDLGSRGYADERLLSWFLQMPIVAPLLTSVNLTSALTDTDLARAFCHLAFVDGLEEASFDVSVWDAPDNELQAAIADIASLCYGGSRYISGPDEPMYREFQTSHEQQQQQQLVRAGRRPSAQLKRLSIAVAVEIIHPLALLLPSITHLSLDVPNGVASEDEASPDEVHRVCERLGTLRQLRMLSLHLPIFSPISCVDIQALHGLKHLRELHIVGGSSDDICSNDIGDLLLALPHLSTLTLDFGLPCLSSDLLTIVAESSPQLRHLYLHVRIDLAEALEDCRLRPLLPSLESLGVGSLDEGFKPVLADLAKWYCLNSRSLRIIGFCISFVTTVIGRRTGLTSTSYLLGLISKEPKRSNRPSFCTQWLQS
jgi:hypothetical protein